MEYFSLYRHSRNSAWRALLDFKISRLPVPVLGMAKKMNIPVQSYEEGKQLLSDFNLLALSKTVSGLTVCEDEQFYIFYDPSTVQNGRARFTVAHELGHILLGHMDTLQGRVKVLSRVNAGDLQPRQRDPQERAADIFASRLLAPACVLHPLKAYTPDSITHYCGISHQAASFRAERMKELVRRGAWGSNPLELQVYEQFSDFVKGASI